MPTFDQALNTVYGYIRRDTALNPRRRGYVTAVMDATGRPHTRFDAVHIAGTKGKGSTAAMLAAALQANGYRVGLYTSPHLHRITERIQVNGRAMPDADFITTVEKLHPHFNAIDDVGYPEVITCLAFHHFAAENVDIAVIEAHLGGQHDATNIITPLCSVLTTIDYDHTDVLGNTLAKIARQKAGIIKPGVPVVSAPQSAEALTVIREQAATQNAPLTVTGQDNTLTLAPATADGQTITLDHQEWKTALIGQHQGINLAVAVSTLEQLKAHYPLNDVASKHGFASVTWGGRLEIIRRDPLTLLDIAHNPAAARVLRQALDGVFSSAPRVFIYGSKTNKDISGILRTLLREQDTLILTAAADPPTAPPDDLAAIAQSAGVQRVQTAVTIADALNQAQSMLPAQGLICITGSIFVVAEARATLR